MLAVVLAVLNSVRFLRESFSFPDSAKSDSSKSLDHVPRTKFCFASVWRPGVSSDVPYHVVVI